MKGKKEVFLIILSFLLIFGIPIIISIPKTDEKIDPKDFVVKRLHVDHSHFFTQEFKTPQDVTMACLKCHEDVAGDFMKTSHWTWHGDAKISGKKESFNNFCISIKGNEARCTVCHAGYGWKDENFDFSKKENIDCLVCHEQTGTYVKDLAGLPTKESNLLNSAKSVSFPKRDNCGTCHYYGGGGMGVKHGDLDSSLAYPTEEIDVHMGKNNMLCIDCHKTTNHNITGKAYSVSTTPQNGFDCTECHQNHKHTDARIDTHLDTVACQTCHIPTYAKKHPTKMDWDWSKGGDPNREEDTHKYLRKKGEFIYAEDVRPQYAWFNKHMKLYQPLETVDPENINNINTPQGSVSDSTAKIWPFKIHTGKQIYDLEHKYLLTPTTFGKDGFWKLYDWDKAARAGSEASKIPYSGSYGFVKTRMYWPLSHMVSPKESALTCDSCHSDNGVLNWKELGYIDDPIKIGGRKKQNLLKEVK
ncbi:tetrathionate reductase family octaheme c-type cytochrome [bacterium]|nr:tetrathionate reductase family octaheme c-type cytochrome [bacterium]